MSKDIEVKLNEPEISKQILKSPALDSLLKQKYVSVNKKVDANASEVEIRVGRLRKRTVRKKTNGRKYKLEEASAKYLMQNGNAKQKKLARWYYANKK
ncbi:hypothetical protein [Mycoplasma sp. P36-A1]|uniref:hypothetical protein n=1 Tax=Mycoplasma sp. P36-A1 TaxID=3252900 RepID=UPI003C2CCA3A